MANLESRNNDEQLNPSKRQRLDEAKELIDAMLCNVCRELPHPDTFYKCHNGHMLCESCYSHIVVYGLKKNSVAKCPACRVPIGEWELDSIRDCTISRILRSLGTKCLQCEQKLFYDELPEHKDKCIKRNVACEYRCLGCEWRGPYNDSDNHKETCDFIKKSSDEILAALDVSQESQLCHNELSSNRILFKDINLSRCTRVNENFTVYDSLALEGFEEVWRLVVSVDYGITPGFPKMSYRLLLITAPKNPIEVVFFVTMPVHYHTGNQWSDIALKRCSHCFSEDSHSSSLHKLKIVSNDATFRYLAKQPICLSLWMMLH